VTLHSGPRHSTFHLSGKFAHVIGEMVSSITAFPYDASLGAITWVQTVWPLPADFTTESLTTDIFLHPNSQWMYGSNRGHDSIAHLRHGSRQWQSDSHRRHNQNAGAGIDPVPPSHRRLSNGLCCLAVTACWLEQRLSPRGRLRVQRWQ